MSEPTPEVEMLRAQVRLLTEAHSKASEMNRSAWQIAERDGRGTNWEGFRASLRDALETSHEALHIMLTWKPRS